MADESQLAAELLFSSFLAPLVLGGTVGAQKPIGGKNAVRFVGHLPSDPDLVSRTSLARIRVARALAPIDTLDPLPTADEWMLAAALHDIVQSTHPDFDAALRRKGPAKILAVVESVLDLVGEPDNVGEALSRHTWFSRIFELARTDTTVSWWLGSQTFLGTDPPPRLLAWPELRRVDKSMKSRPLMDLPTSGAVVNSSAFEGVIRHFLRRSPLTDLATLNRESPAFVWTHENLRLCSTHGGRTLALRALAFVETRSVDAILGRATRIVFEAGAKVAGKIVVELLRERAMMAASSRIGRDREAEPLTLGTQHDDAALAVSAGAFAASQWILTNPANFDKARATELLGILSPATRGAQGQEFLTSLLAE